MRGETPWVPTSQAQWLGLLSQADELFYGGAAGGGKTDLLLGLAITAHSKSIIFRREYEQLKAIEERSQELLGELGRYNAQRKMWRLPGGRRIDFGAVQYERDKGKWQGRPHDLKAFDEGAAFTESQYRFLTAWTRTTDPDQRVRVVVASNPPTQAEGEWIIRYWGPWLDDQHPDPAEPGELRWFAVVDGEDVERENGETFSWKGEELRPKSRTFIPASLRDNPYLLATDYATVLQNLPEPLRSQLLYGDFSAGIGDDPWQIIPTEWVRVAQQRWRETEKPDLPMTALGVDPARGGGDKTVLARRHGTWFAQLEKHSGSSTPDGPAVAALAVAALDGDREAAINIDVIAIGSSPYDTLASQGLNVVAVNFAESSNATDRSGRLKMRNVRAQAYWGMREALDPEHGEGLALPPDSELLADLVAPRWKITTSGIQVESKEEIIKRLGRSPDCGDAAVLALLDISRKMVGWADVPIPDTERSKWRIGG